MRQSCVMASRAEQPIRKFDQIHRDLEEVVAKLKDCGKPEERRDLLLALRLLLVEADAATEFLDKAITHLTLVPKPAPEPA